jgi:ectoine hydroxylase-related dioxygenase (phytanoyl-CoA dioxygenase family)
MVTIKDEMKSFFEKNGYCILKDAINKNKLLDLESDINSLFKRFSVGEENIHELSVRLDKENKKLLYKLFSMIKDMSSFLTVSNDCFELSKQILPPGIISSAGQAVLLGLPDDERLVYDWHQESAYMAYPDTLHFQFPIFRPANLENGTMSVLSCSQKLGELTYDSFQKTKDSLVNLKVRGIDKYSVELEEVPFLMDLGDVGVFHNNLIHRSNHNGSHFVRFSGVVRVNSINDVASDERIELKKARKSSPNN